jgi:hypothetical protein
MIGYYQYTHSVGHSNERGPTCHNVDHQGNDTDESHYKITSPRLIEYSK